MPLIFESGYREGEFERKLVRSPFVFTWICNNTSGSILAAILIHASMNRSIRLAMPGMQLDWPTGGFMVGFLVIAALIILKLWGAAHLSREQR